MVDPAELEAENCILNKPGEDVLSKKLPHATRLSATVDIPVSVVFPHSSWPLKGRLAEAFQALAVASAQV